MLEINYLKDRPPGHFFKLIKLKNKKKKKEKKKMKIFDGL